MYSSRRELSNEDLVQLGMNYEARTRGEATGPSTVGRRSISSIEVLNVKATLFYAIILLLYLTHIKVLKDALAHLGPYQTLMWVRYSDPGG